MGILVSVLAALSAAPSSDLPKSYVVRVERTLQLCRADLAGMQPVAEQAAARLVKGGALWAAGQPSFVSEISGRAGGIMMIRNLAGKTPGENDVVLDAPEPDDAQVGKMLGSSALVVLFGGSLRKDAPWFSNHAEVCGISPTLANAIPAWIFTGELVAALTRLGKMPVMYETVGAYGGNARIQQYHNGEVRFHDDKTVPPVAPGVIGNRFVDAVSAMLSRVEKEERENLDRAGQWAREAKAANKRLYMYSMGHLFPDEVGKTGIGKVFRSAVWNAGFRNAAPEDPYEAGDLAVLIGYQHPADALLRRTRPCGARVVYVSLHADRNFVRDPGVIWIDPMWDWPDACVTLEGYDVPLLPASGIVNGAIAWEIYRLTVEP